MLVLRQEDLLGLLPPLRIVEAVESSLRAHVAGNVVMPKRLHVDWRGNTLLAMPAAGEGGSGVKIVSVVPGNAARGLPVTSGVMILNDASTAIPVALMNAAALTAQRTGAVGALGAKYMTPEDTSTVGIVGCGVQGAWQAIFACAVRPIREIFCVASSGASLDKFIATVKRHAGGVQIIPCRDASELLGRTELVITATTSAQPVLPDDAGLLRNKHFISVGSFRPSMQELPNSVYELAGAVAVDSVHGCQEVGDLINPLQQGLIDQAAVFPIAECVTGARTMDVQRTTVYKSVGAALFDLFVAQAFYHFAKSRGVGINIDI